jgi:hypothetical protein
MKYLLIYLAGVITPIVIMFTYVLWLELTDTDD